MKAVVPALVMLSLAAQARAATAQWTPFKVMDPVTDATREGVSYMDVDDGLFVVCTHQKDARARTRFWIEVKTGAHLGRGNTRSLTYRVGGDDPTTSRWEYTPRGAMPSWPMEDRHLIERVIDRKAEKVVFRLFGYDGLPHDVSVPVDEAARELMGATIAKCRA